MSRIFITLNPQELDALRTLAEREFRDPRAQAALIIRVELEKRRLLPADPALAVLAPDKPKPCEATHAG